MNASEKKKLLSGLSEALEAICNETLPLTELDRGTVVKLCTVAYLMRIEAEKEEKDDVT